MSENKENKISPSDDSFTQEPTLTDEDMEQVVGGLQWLNGQMIVNAFYSCDHYMCALGVEENNMCCSCHYNSSMGIVGICTHQANKR